jgi:hypothetical protein
MVTVWSPLRTAVTMGLIGFLSVPSPRPAEAHSLCGCDLCWCFKIRQSTGECDVPAVEPCDCWQCLE